LKTWTWHDDSVSALPSKLQGGNSFITRQEFGKFMQALQKTRIKKTRPKPGFFIHSPRSITA
jgi:hypothetical protein